MDSAAAGDLRLAVVDADDAAALARVWHRANARRVGAAEDTVPPPDAISRLGERLRAPGTVVVAGTLLGEMITTGFGSPLLGPDDQLLAGSAHVSLLSVDPRWWGRGYGRATLDFLVSALSMAGYEMAQLHVLENNNRARALYERAGWRLVRVGDSHPDGPQAVYERNLRS